MAGTKAIAVMVHYQGLIDTLYVHFGVPFLWLELGHLHAVANSDGPFSGSH